jgi:cephalosporin hydroxylase
MEENLDMPLRKVLSIIQDRIKNQTTYFGIKTFKNPIDYWVYQEIIFECKPDVIVEIGNAHGGATLSLAHICDLIGTGRIIGVDLSHKAIPEHVKKHPRITLIDGDACQCFKHVESLISKEERVLVIEDSSHTYDNTLNVLRIYSALTKPGDYFIVEDSICHHGLSVGPEPGPYEAIETFLKENTDFDHDRSRESFLLTWNPKGYLRRSRSGRKDSGVKDHKPLRTKKRTPKSSVQEILKLFLPPILVRLIRKLRS